MHERREAEMKSNERTETKKLMEAKKFIGVCCEGVKRKMLEAKCVSNCSFSSWFVVC